MLELETLPHLPRGQVSVLSLSPGVARATVNSARGQRSPAQASRTFMCIVPSYGSMGIGYGVDTSVFWNEWDDVQTINEFFFLNERIRLVSVHDTECLNKSELCDFRENEHKYNKTRVVRRVGSKRGFTSIINIMNIKFNYCLVGIWCVFSNHTCLRTALRASCVPRKNFEWPSRFYRGAHGSPRAWGLSAFF